MTIAIIGLGYVGLPLALQFARSDVTVLGLDIDQTKVDRLNRGESYIKHIAATDIAAAIAQGRFSASTDFSRVAEVEAVIICVPTPLGENREPDISYILNTGRAIAPYLRPPPSDISPQVSGLKSQVSASPTPTSDLRPPTSDPYDPSSVFGPQSSALGVSAFPKLVVLESTTYPGTTEEDLKNVLEEFSAYSDLRPLTSDLRPSPRRLVAGIDFHLAFSPEREDPGNPNSRVSDIPKVVGGYTPACLERAKALYSKAIKTVIPVSSCRVAEATKLLENIFRSVNIALVNELKLVYAAMGIDIWEVINAAKTKPFGFMPFYPGPGLGGHCIPIDPFYLSWKARQAGKETRFIELAGEINTAMPEYVVSRVAAALAAKQNTLSASIGERAGVRCREDSLHSPLSTLHSTLSPDVRPPASDPSVSASQLSASENPASPSRAEALAKADALLQSRRSSREGGRPPSGSPSLPSEAGGEGRGEEASHPQSVLPTSDLRPPTSDLGPPTSDLRPPTSGPLSSGPNEPLSGSKVLILGLAYKPNVDDDRESPTYVLMDLLKARGAEVAYYDPFVPVIRPSREHSHWAGTRSVSWDQKTISSFDAVLISTAHADVNYRQLAEWSPCIIDTRNVMAARPTKPGQVWKA